MNMQFVNSRYNNNIQPFNYQQNNPIRIMPFARKNVVQYPVAQPQVTQQEVVPVDKPNPKKIRWGAPTWFLFHTLAHKIKDEHFSKIKPDLFNNIKIICRNLPCPKCADHATDYMSKININSINTKEDLKNMLFKFHNDVNVRTGALLFSYSELNDKYSTAVTINIVQNFFIFFKDKSFNVTAIANSMHRDRITITLKEWFQKNIQYFDL